MFRYAYYLVVFHVARTMQDFPGLSFKAWVYFMQMKLDASKAIIKAKEVDWGKETSKR